MLSMPSHLPYYSTFVVFSDEDSRNSEQEEYCYAYRDEQSVREDEYYISGDEIIEFCKKATQRHNKSIKGSRSMDNIPCHTSCS